MRLIDVLPPDIAARHAARELGAAAAIARQDVHGALAIWQADYDDLLSAQPPDRRYHKGQPLANIGVLRLYLGEGAQATEATILAFIEDALSRGEESPGRHDELYRTAAFNLAFIFSVPPRVIAGLASWVRSLVEAGRFYPDPRPLLAEPIVQNALSLSELYVGQLIPGKFYSPPHRRVFVGGSYADGRLTSVLRPIAEIVKDLAYEAILAADYAIPENVGTDEHALMLMASSHYAIFEFSAPGGHEQEFTRLPDTLRTRTLVLYDARAVRAPTGSSGMTREPMARWGITPIAYSSEEDLRNAIVAFLQART